MTNPATTVPVQVNPELIRRMKRFASLFRGQFQLQNVKRLLNISSTEHDDLINSLDANLRLAIENLNDSAMLSSLLNAYREEYERFCKTNPNNDDTKKPTLSESEKKKYLEKEIIFQFELTTLGIIKFVSETTSNPSNASITASLKQFAEAERVIQEDISTFYKQYLEIKCEKSSLQIKGLILNFAEKNEINDQVSTSLESAQKYLNGVKYLRNGEYNFLELTNEYKKLLKDAKKLLIDDKDNLTLRKLDSFYKEFIQFNIKATKLTEDYAKGKYSKEYVNDLFAKIFKRFKEKILTEFNKHAASFERASQITSIISLQHKTSELAKFHKKQDFKNLRSLLTNYILFFVPIDHSESQKLQQHIKTQAAALDSLKASACSDEQNFKQYVMTMRDREVGIIKQFKMLQVKINEDLKTYDPENGTKYLDNMVFVDEDGNVTADTKDQIQPVFTSQWQHFTEHKIYLDTTTEKLKDRLTMLQNAIYCLTAEKNDSNSAVSACNLDDKTFNVNATPEMLIEKSDRIQQQVYKLSYDYPFTDDLTLTQIENAKKDLETIEKGLETLKRRNQRLSTKLHNAVFKPDSQLIETLTPAENILLNIHICDKYLKYAESLIPTNDTKSLIDRAKNAYDDMQKGIQTNQSMLLVKYHVFNEAKTKLLPKDDISCDVIEMLSPPCITTVTQNMLPLLSLAAYVRYNDQLFYVNRLTNECTELKVNTEILNEFDLNTKPDANGKAATLSKDQLSQIQQLTGHEHKVTKPEQDHQVYQQHRINAYKTYLTSLPQNGQLSHLALMNMRRDDHIIRVLKSVAIVFTLGGMFGLLLPFIWGVRSKDTMHQINALTSGLKAHQPPTIKSPSTAACAA